MNDSNVYTPPQSRVEASSATQYGPARSLGQLPAYLIALLKINLVLSLYGLYLSAASAINLMQNGLAEELEFSDIDMQFIVYSLVYMLISIPTTIVFCIWIYRAQKNAYTFGNPIRISPAMAAGSFFIPVISLYKPYQAMKELWLASSPAKNLGHGPVKAWWALWIFSGITTMGASFFSLSQENLTMQISSGVITTVGSVIFIILCVLAIKLVNYISSNQEQIIAQD